MDRRKPRRSAKWLPKLFRKDSGIDGPTRSTSERKSLQEVGRTSSQATTSKGTISIVAASTSIESSCQTKVVQRDIQVITPSLPSKTENHVEPQVSIDSKPLAPTPGDPVANPDPVNFQNPFRPQKASSVSVSPVLTTPSVKNFAKSTSPYQQAENQVKLSPLLDPETCMSSAKLWEKAYTQLSENEKHSEVFKRYAAILEENSPALGRSPSFPQKMQAVVRRQIEFMKQKQWVLQWDQKSIVVRDQVERIVNPVQTFSKLGTTIAQFDPVHVGIPWAGVCAILTLILNDSTQHQEALNGLDEVSSIVARYIAIEDVYVQSCTLDPRLESNAGFEASIIKVYSSVLLFQVQAALYFHRSTMTRVVSNIVKLVEWKDLLSNIRKDDHNCVATASMIGIAHMGSFVSGIHGSLLDMKQRCEEIHDISKALYKFREDWEKKQTSNAGIVSWVSDVPVGEEHDRVRAKLGARYWDAGQWFLQNLEFKDWKTTPRGQFWLQGSVGTGKTSLASIVIHDLIKTGNHPSIAFYYCSHRSAEVANNPTAIFRSLVAQLSCDSEGKDVYPVIRDLWQRDANRYAMRSRLSLAECEELLVTLMKLRGKTAIVIDGLDECSEPMQLLRSLHQVWKDSNRLKIFLTSRLDVAATEVFPKIKTIRSDFAKTADDIRECIRKELQRKERRNAKVITEELAERMVNILTQRAQGMFRWVELQLNLLINPERRIKYRLDFEDGLNQLESGSGKEVLDSLRGTYDYIYETNTQGIYSRKLAERSLQWVLRAARPMKIWELGAAVSVGAEGRVTTDLINGICSNFLTVGPRGVVQLAHLSVREYLEVKNVEGRLTFSSEEAHAEAAITCLRYWIVVARKFPVFEPGENDDSEDDRHGDHGGPENDASSSWDSARRDVDSEYQVEPTSDENPGVYGSESVSESCQRPSVTVALEKSSSTDAVDTDTDAKVSAEIEVKQRRELRNQEKPSESQEEVTTPEGHQDTSNHESNAQVAITIVTPSEKEDPNNTSPYGPPNSDYFSQIDSYLKTDAAASLKPHEAFKRFQRYASIYWAIHCQAAKSVRFNESRKLLWEFLAANGSKPAFQIWATTLLNEAKLASLPTIHPAPILFVPATAHERVIWDAEPTYERWQQTIAYVDGPQPLMPTVALIACFRGFTDILRGISGDGSAQMSRNHEGITGLVLAARNGHDEVLKLPISSSFDLDAPDNKGETTLHHAAIGGYVELARLLLGYPRELSARDGKSVQKSRVNVNAKDLRQRTPLHYSAELGQVEIIKLLLDEDDIDVHVRDAYGYTALGLCLQNEEVAGLLRADRRYEEGDEFSQAGLEYR